jgi:hypothetical protein
LFLQKSIIDINTIPTTNLSLPNMSLTQYNSCAFCRANQQTWNHPLKNMDDKVVCVALLNYKCPFCKETGHTTKHCKKLAEKQQRDLQRSHNEQERYTRWEHNRQVREQEKVRLESEKAHKIEAKASSWAGKVAKAIPEEERQKIEEENIRLKKAEVERQAALAKKRAEDFEKQQLENKRLWEQNYLYKMPKFYGLQKAYGQFPVGSFWEFFIEGRKHNGKPVDHEIAKTLRENGENQLKFRSYLKIKYYEWLWDTEDTEDDCPFLMRDRDRERCAMEDISHYHEQRAREEISLEELERRDMERKFASGEITQHQYDSWQQEKDDYLDSWVEGDSLRWQSEEMYAQRNFDAWRERKAEIEGDTGYKARKAEQRKKEAAERKRISDEINKEHKEFMERWRSGI